MQPYPISRFESHLLTPFVVDEGATDKWSIDPIQVPNGPITRARAKIFKETLNGLIQSIWVEESSCWSKGDAKCVLQDWASLIQAEV